MMQISVSSSYNNLKFTTYLLLSLLRIRHVFRGFKVKMIFKVYRKIGLLSKTVLRIKYVLR